MTLTQEKKQSAGQLKLLTRMIGDIAESDQVQDALKALDKDGSERLKGHPEFVKSLREYTIERIRELTCNNKFANEEVESSYGYLSGYKPKSITEQSNRLRGLIPDIGYANEKLADGTLPPNAEGWFAIPRWEKFAPTYNEAVQKVFDLIKQIRNGKFYNYRDGELVPDHLRQTAKTASMFQKLGDEQKGYDILVVPAQFGIRHRGRSVRRAREVFASNEFGLGAFAIGIMLLTHPERLQHYDDLRIDCAGDEFSPDGDGEFSTVPYFRFDVDEVGFASSGVGGAGDRYGTASGFLPQS